MDKGGAMDELLSVAIYFVVLFIVIGGIKKAGVKKLTGRPGTGNVSARTGNFAGGSVPAQSTSMPHVHKNAGAYDTFNKKGNESGTMPHKHSEKGVYETFNRRGNASGTMPHKHETGHYTSMADASKLPPGYILLNGEPVRVADLEGK